MGKSDKQEQITAHFDYDILKPTQRSIVRQRTVEIRERLQRTAQDIWEIGQRLAEVRAQLKHGQFDAWLKAEFGWSRRTAYNFINVYETFSERANLAQIDIATSALYLLAAPSTPQDLRDQYLQQAKDGKKVTHKDLRDRIEQGRSQTEVVKETEVQTVTQPEIVTLIRQADGVVSSAIPASDWMAQTVTKTPVNLKQPLQPGWYLLGQKHLVFCGDTATSDFYSLLPKVAFALAATAEDWDHDWLIDAVPAVTVVPEKELEGAMVEQLINLFSKRKDTIVFPWLPHPEMLAIAHRLERKVVGGDLSPERCQRAIQATGLPVIRIEH